MKKQNKNKVQRGINTFARNCKHDCTSIYCQQEHADKQNTHAGALVMSERTCVHSVYNYVSICEAWEMSRRRQSSGSTSRNAASSATARREEWRG